MKNPHRSVMNGLVIRALLPESGNGIHNLSETLLPRFRQCWTIGLVLLFSACTNPRIERQIKDIPVGISYQPANVFSVEFFPASLRRLAFLPVNCEDWPDADPLTVTRTLQAELGRTGRFEVVAISPGFLFELTGRESISTQEEMPLHLLAFLANSLKVDGVFQADLTEWRPYRPMVAGIRARIFDIREQQILWAVDERINSGEATVNLGMRKFSRSQFHREYPFSDSRAVMRSPGNFLSYSAFSIFQTLPRLSGQENKP